MDHGLYYPVLIEYINIKNLALLATATLVFMFLFPVAVNIITHIILFSQGVVGRSQ